MYFTYSQSKNQQHSNRKQTSNTLDKLMQFLKATSTTALQVSLWNFTRKISRKRRRAQKFF